MSRALTPRSRNIGSITSELSVMNAPTATRQCRACHAAPIEEAHAGDLQPERHLADVRWRHRRLAPERDVEHQSLGGVELAQEASVLVVAVVTTTG
jgi:hypothetical protein